MDTDSRPFTQTNIADRTEWEKRYWFTPLQTVTVVNPLTYDYNFTVEGRHFVVEKGKHRTFPGTIANVYLSHVTRIMSQDDGKMEHLSDYNLMAQYYEKLIVDRQDAQQEVDLTPAYLRAAPMDTETPPWQQLTPPPATTPQDVPTVPPVKEEPKEETKEFTLGEDAYKMITNKLGRTMFYKNNKMTSEVEYAKAASQL